MPDLHALRLDSNRLIDFGQAFVNLRFLLMLNISSNSISSFDYAQIPLGLQWLDLHSNRIDKLNNFYYSPTAQQQFSAANDIGSQQSGSSIGQQWQSMLRLTTLDVSHNLIRELDNTSLPESLETVQLNNNHIRTISSQTFSTKSNLTKINLSNNQLTTMPLEALKLHSNRDIQQQILATTTSSNGGQQQQKFVDIQLANNPFVCNCNMGWLSQLLLASSTLMQSAAGGSSSMNGASSVAAVQGALPRDHAFTNTYALILARQLPRVVDAHLINCHLQFGRQTPFTTDSRQWSPVQAANQLALHHNHHLHLRDSPLILKQSELLASVHLCPYKSHCFALCFCCDFDACDCEMSCPENCSCYYDQTWSTNIVDCSANNQINGNSQARFAQMMMGAASAAAATTSNHLRQTSTPTGSSSPQVVKFSSIPEKIPMDVTELYLDGLELVHLRGNALIGRKNLKSLYLNNSQLYSIESKALATQKALRVLQLNSNFLTELRGHEFEQQVELRELYLAHNRLSSIANTTFAPLRSLQVLHLQNNQLYHFNFWSNLPTGQHKLISVNLGQNPWSCQCEYIESMLQWLQLNVKHLHDRKSISCQYNRTTSLHLVAPSSTSLATTADNESSLTKIGYGPALVGENYPMFDMRLCLNYTVEASSPAPSIPRDTPADESSYPPRQIEDSTTNASNGYVPLPNDAPIIPSQRGDPLDSIDSLYSQQPTTSQPSARQQPIRNGDGSAQPDAAAKDGYHFPPESNPRAPLLSSSFLLCIVTMILVAVVLVLSLVHYRRSMRMWFYSNYGLNMFSASKSHKHAVHGKHHHPHLHHQYGASSAGSTSSSSAASSNLSQALCQQQSANGPSGLVTTPLIVTNSNHQILNSNATPNSPYNDEEKLFDAYLTYSKLDEGFVNDFIASELEYGQPSYR